MHLNKKGEPNNFARFLYDAFIDACMDFKHLLDVNFDAIFTCQCEFEIKGPARVIYDNACNALRWVIDTFITTRLLKHAKCLTRIHKVMPVLPYPRT